MKNTKVTIENPDGNIVQWRGLVKTLKVSSTALDKVLINKFPAEYRSIINHIIERFAHASTVCHAGKIPNDEFWKRYDIARENVEFIDENNLEKIATVFTFIFNYWSLDYKVIKQ